MNTCAHCGTEFRVGGSLHTGGIEYPLCHPNDGLDCYRLVTVYGEPIGARMPVEGSPSWSEDMFAAPDAEERARMKATREQRLAARHIPKDEALERARQLAERNADLLKRLAD